MIPLDDSRPGRVRFEEFGLESVLRSHNPYIKNKNDICVVWLHYVCLRNLLKSHGGEGMITELRTETLPRNLAWNGVIQRYLIKYEYKFATFILGIYIREKEADCSLVTLQKSLRIGIPIDDLVHDDLTVVDSVVDTFTEVVEKNFIQPMISARPVEDPWGDALAQEGPARDNSGGTDQSFDEPSVDDQNKVVDNQLSKVALEFSWPRGAPIEKSVKVG